MDFECVILVKNIFKKEINDSAYTELGPSDLSIDPFISKKNQMAMSFYSGKDKDDAPKICVNGLRLCKRFDGFLVNICFKDSFSDSTELILFLEKVVVGELIAVVSFDEASNRLSGMAKQIFYEFGSSLIHNIKFRSSWYFVGQKGINGFSPFEDLILSSGVDWAKPINKRMCFSSFHEWIFGFEDSKYNSFNQNTLRRHFCAKYDGYEDFCSGSKPNCKRQFFIFQKVVILILHVKLKITGLNMNNIRLCLESVLAQNGINMQKVIVAYDSAYNEVGDLANLFGGYAMPIENASSYNGKYNYFYFYSEYLIVIKEDVLLLSDFLSFLARLLPQFSDDGSSGVILTWNRNGSFFLYRYYIILILH
ncbi:unnamed protein product [Dracunculus medinensis]|uniref:ILEI/PANDER domain-containing protein n=1 Tax=Dracunculus medinensis TaxID=318479 RepID=A0A3P7SUT8_DRAME|nr:unnamed protein product [Dracunculus medinensis]